MPERVCPTLVPLFLASRSRRRLISQCPWTTGNPIALSNGSDPQAAPFHEVTKRPVERLQAMGAPAGPSMTIED